MSLTELTGNPRHDRLLMLIDERGYMNIDELASLLEVSTQTVRRDIRKLSEQGHRVVVLSNTNRLHTHFWPEEYPEVRAAADHIYLSQDLGMRKPEARIYQHVLQKEGFSAADAVFFDDNADNIEGANQLGITSILVKDKATIPDYFAKLLC
ncbi:HAD-IA family hydrolase [Salmonella enterica]|nr:HAD-IA family hydrolase [Salmonella enterica]